MLNLFQHPTGQIADFAIAYHGREDIINTTPPIVKKITHNHVLIL